MIATVETLEGQKEIPIEVISFSAFRCFTSAKQQATEHLLYKYIADELLDEAGPIALYGSGIFTNNLLASNIKLASKIKAIIDPSFSPGILAKIPTVPQWQSLVGQISTVFLCELSTERRWRLRKILEPHFRVLCPDILSNNPDSVPRESWVIKHHSIYPIDVPAIELASDLDVLLLDLPARNNFALPLSLGYVHKAIKKISGIKAQTLDADAIFYHRYHIWRLFDLGEEVVLMNNRVLPEDPWSWTEECWMDPRCWHSLYSLFSRDIDELVAKIIAAKPKVLALTVHQRNEWITRLVAYRAKERLPELQILAGGHSCVSASFGPKAFPEYDYMVIGEVEAVLEPLIRQLVAGVRPHSLPGIVSKHDPVGWTFEPSLPPQNLDEVGAPDYDWDPGFNTFLNFRGGILPYLNLTRGCIWGRCTFCSERFPFRTKSAKTFVDELERFYDMGIRYFNFSESDFGGRMEILNEVADEILRRGLKLQLNGQIRVNPKYDVNFLKKLVAAGIGCNFGIDAVTTNTLKLQRKGYTLQTIESCLHNCKEAGINVWINLVVGVPGETEQDVDDTLNFIISHKDYITTVFNISPFYLMHDCIYWNEPEAHGIRFLDEKTKLFGKYFHGIPDRYWYSVVPYIDGAIRRRRAYRIMTQLRAAGIVVDSFGENSVMRPMFDGFQNPRDIAAEIPDLTDYRLFVADKKHCYDLTNKIEHHTVIKDAVFCYAIPDYGLKTLKECTGKTSLRYVQ